MIHQSVEDIICTFVVDIDFWQGTPSSNLEEPGGGRDRQMKLDSGLARKSVHRKKPCCMKIYGYEPQRQSCRIVQKYPPTPAYIRIRHKKKKKKFKTIKTRHTCNLCRESTIKLRFILHTYESCGIATISLPKKASTPSITT
jgi:hypothetical protein